MRAFCIHILGIGCYHIGGNITHHIQDTVITIHSIRIVLGCFVILVFVLVGTLLEFHDALHQRTVLQLELNLFPICIIVGHDALL